MSSAPAPCRCELCPATFTQAGAGRPRRYCADCEDVGKALRALEKALAARPVAIRGVIEAIEQVEIPAGTLGDADARALRASAFTLASRGRRLAPGSSGRYTRKGAAKTEKAEPAGALLELLGK